MIATGKRVIIVHSSDDYGTGDEHFPPEGVLGTCMSEIDKFDEYDILFDGHFCPVGDPYWITHREMIVFLDNDPKPQEEVSKKKGKTCLSH